MPVVFSGVSLGAASGWGGDAATQLPPCFLSPGRMSSPQGHPDGVLAGSEQSVEHVGEVRGRGGRQVGGPFPPRPLGLGWTPAAWCCSFQDESHAREGFAPAVSLCPQVPGTDGQELAVPTRDGDRTEEGG